MEKNTKGERTQKKIEQCFIHLMRIKRWDCITVRELCTVCEISRGTFYLYYDDIGNLVERIHERLLQDLKSELGRSKCKPVRQYKEGETACAGSAVPYADDPAEAFVVLLRFCRRNLLPLIAMTDPEKGDLRFQKHFGDAVKLVFDEMMDRDGMPNDYMRAHYQDVMLSIILSVLPIWLADEQNISEAKVAEILTSLRSGAIQIFRERLSK